MPDLGTGLVAHLGIDAAVQAEFGNPVRVYREHMPQEPVFPAVVYSRTSTQRQLTLEGPIGLTVAHMSVDIIGKTAMQVYDGAVAIKNSLDGVTGDLGGVSVQVVYYTDESDFSQFEGDVEFRVISLSLSVILNE